MTDEEIIQLAKENGLSWALRIPVDHQNLLDFARALLERHAKN